jgi:hypothetical protein
MWGMRNKWSAKIVTNMRAYHAGGWVDEWVGGWGWTWEANVLGWAELRKFVAK